MTPEERELKNKRIRESVKATREKRKNQRAMVFIMFEMDRDTHAALNMIILALEPLPAYWWRAPEFKPLNSVKSISSGLTVRESAVINHAGLHSIAGNVSRLVTPDTRVSDGGDYPIAVSGQ